MDPGKFNLIQAIDRACQLSFQGSLIVYLLHEICHTQRVGIKKLITFHVFSSSASKGRKLHSKLVHLVVWHIDGTAFTKFIADTLSVKFSYDLLGCFRLKSPKQK